MNAVEARKLSNSNVPKLVSAHIKLAISQINVQIKESAKIGRFTSSTSICLPGNFQKEVIDQLISHYLELGYEVKTCNLLKSITFSVSWE